MDKNNITIYANEAVVPADMCTPYTKREMRRLIDNNIKNISKLTSDVDQLKHEAGLIPTEENLAYYYTKDETNSTFYTKGEIDTMMNNIDVDVDLSSYYSKSYIDSNFYNANYIDSHYYDKDNTYTKTEISNLISQIPSSSNNITVMSYSDYENLQNPDNNQIYFTY